MLLPVLSVFTGGMFLIGLVASGRVMPLRTLRFAFVFRACTIRLFRFPMLRWLLRLRRVFQSFIGRGFAGILVQRLTFFLIKGCCLIRGMAILGFFSFL